MDLESPLLTRPRKPLHWVYLKKIMGPTNPTSFGPLELNGLEENQEELTIFVENH